MVVDAAMAKVFVPLLLIPLRRRIGGELWLWVGMEPMDTSNFSEKREARAELGFHLQWQQAGQALILSERVFPLPTHSIALLLDSSLEKLAFFGASSSPSPLTP